MALAAPGAGLRLSRASTTVCARPVLELAPLVCGPDGPRDARDELIAAIRVWEGEAMADPPVLFKLVVALGAAMLGGAGLLVLGLAL